MVADVPVAAGSVVSPKTENKSSIGDSADSGTWSDAIHALVVVVTGQKGFYFTKKLNTTEIGTYEAAGVRVQDIHEVAFI